MKLLFKVLVVIFLTTMCMCFCSKSENIRDGLSRGMYDVGTRIPEMQHADDVSQPGEVPLTYDQYQQERQEMVTDQEHN